MDPLFKTKVYQHLYQIDEQLASAYLSKVGVINILDDLEKEILKCPYHSHTVTKNQQAIDICSLSSDSDVPIINDVEIGNPIDSVEQPHATTAEQPLDLSIRSHINDGERNDYRSLCTVVEKPNASIIGNQIPAITRLPSNHDGTIIAQSIIAVKGKKFRNKRETHFPVKTVIAVVRQCNEFQAFGDMETLGNSTQEE